MSDDTPALRRRARRIVRTLADLYPEAFCGLTHADPVQLLVATILSAQCTDVHVNLVTPALFAHFPTAEAFAAVEPAEVEPYIRSVGVYRNKARNIVACCRALVEQHGGRVPERMDDLVRLPGVGRKTANVVLGDAFGVPGIAVDTHVARVSRRLGLTTSTNPVVIESDLYALVPRADWTTFGHRLILHGRGVCHARKPECDTCRLADLCPKIGTRYEVPATTDADTVS